MAKRRRAPANIAELGDLEAVTAKFEEVRASRIVAEKDGRAWTAVSTLHRLEAELLARMAELRAVNHVEAEAQPSELAERSDNELAEMLIAAIAGIPDPVFDRVEDAVILRRTGKPALRLVDGR